MNEPRRAKNYPRPGLNTTIADIGSPAGPVLKDARAVYTPGISERASGTSRFFRGDALGRTCGITNWGEMVAHEERFPWSPQTRRRCLRSERGRVPGGRAPCLP